MRTGIYLLLQKFYDNYCCHSGKTNEHYFLADLTTVQALHSSHQSVCVCVRGGGHVRMLNINSVHVVMKVIQSHNRSSVTHISAMYR